MSDRGITFDSEADAAYFAVVKDIEAGESFENVVLEREHGTIVLDFDRDGRMLGIEVLGAHALLAPKTLEDAEGIG